MEWYRNDTVFTPSDIDNSKVSSNPKGSSIYRIRSVSTADSAYYKCKVSYNTGSLVGTSSKFAQYVQTIYDTAQTSYNFASQTAILTCSVSGESGTIKWKYDSTNSSEIDYSVALQYSEKLTTHSGFYMRSVLNIARLDDNNSPIKLKCDVAYDSGDSLSRNFEVKTVGKS